MVDIRQVVNLAMSSHIYPTHPPSEKGENATSVEVVSHSVTRCQSWHFYCVFRRPESETAVVPDRVSLGRVHHRRDCQGVKPGPGGSAGLAGGATTISTTRGVLYGDLTIQSYIDCYGVGGFVCSCL